MLMLRTSPTLRASKPKSVSAATHGTASAAESLEHAIVKALGIIDGVAVALS